MKDKSKTLQSNNQADFKNDYRKSSNFPTYNEDEAENFKIEGEGELKVADDKESGITDLSNIVDDLLDSEEE